MRITTIRKSHLVKYTAVFLFTTLFILNVQTSAAQTDLDPPTVLTLSPADDETNVQPGANLVIIFNESILEGSGTIEIRQTSDDSLFVSAGLGNVSLSTTNVANDTATINPQFDLEDSTEYYVIIPNTVFIDASVSANAFAGISDPTAWSFTTGDYTESQIVALTPPDNTNNFDLTQNLSIQFNENVAAGTGNITLYSGTPQELFNDPLDDASLLTVTTGSFFADDDPAFSPDAIFGVNDGLGGGDFGGDTPEDRTTYNGFSGGFLEANGLPFGGTNPVVVEWQNIDITGATSLQFSADFASALQPDTNDFVTIEAIIDGGTPVEILSFTSAAQNSVFRADDSGTSLTATAQNFQRAIPGTGASLTIRATLSLSGTDDSGDDIAIDNVIIAGSGVGSSTLVEQVTASDGNVSIVGNTLTFDPTNDLLELANYYVVVDAGAVTDASVNANDFTGILLDSEWNFTTGDDFAAPTILTLDPADDAVDVGTTPILSVTFDETIQAGTGNITIFTAAGDQQVEQIAIGAANVTIVDDTVTFDPTADFDDLTEYYVIVDAGAVTDASSNTNAFSGITTVGDWSFTTGDYTEPNVVTLTPLDDATNVAPDQSLIIEFDENVAARTGNITLFSGTPQVLLNDPLDDASQLTVTTGNFGVNLDFGPPYTHFGVNDGAGGGDYGGDTPSDRVNYNGFDGGYLEAYGLASLTNPSVVEWQNIDITGATNLQFSADFASALQPDLADSVTIEAIIDGGTPEQILLFNSSTNNGVFRLDGTAIELTDTTQNFQVPITGTGSSLTIRAIFSLSASTPTGDDIAIDNVIVTGSGLGSSTLVEQVTASDGNVSIVDNVLTFDPTDDLLELANYYVVVDAGAVTDASVNANDFKGILDSEWNFTTGDDFAHPTILTLDPADDAVDVGTTPTLSVTFDETVQAGTGNITIHQTSDDAQIASFDVTSDISFSTTTETNDTIQFAPSSPLAESTEYYILIPSGAIQDVAAVPNDFAGITSTTAWSFTTLDQTAPTVVTLTPADDATAVSTNTSLSIVFNESVQAGTGHITLFDSTDAVIELFDVTSDILLSTTNMANDTVTFTPTAELDSLTSYYVQIEATAVTDNATTPNAFAGIADTTTWNFTTAETVVEYLIFLPLVVTPGYPDLIVEDVTVTSTDITVLIRNVGSAPVTGGFYVDAYIGLLDPNTPPTGVNDIWQSFSPQGIVWGIDASIAPIAPGDTLTLTLNDSYQLDAFSNFTMPLPSGTAVYIQVDSASAGNTNGGVLELHEANGDPYNNILGPVLAP